MCKTLVFVFFTVFILFFGIRTSAQSNQDIYGKNRLQYQDFKWSVISTDNFDIYYYAQSKSNAYQAAKYAEFEFNRITDLLGYSPYSRIKLVVYAAHSDLIQSNIGLVGQQVFIGGYTVFTKNKVEISFNGIQTDFQRDIGKGVSAMIINEMMYGGNFKDILQSTYFMSLPEWFLSGLVAYLNGGWSVEKDDQIRDIFASKRFSKPNRFTGQDASIIGHSIWNYAAERYGKATIANVLNATKYLRNHEKGFAEVLNMRYKFLIKEWKDYYQKQAIFAVDSFQMPQKELLLVKNTRNEGYYGSIRISPDGTRLAYVENVRGRYKVIVKNLKTGKKYIVYRGGYRTFDQQIDYVMPVVAWRGNNKIGIISVKHDKMKLVTYDIKQQIENTGERIKLEVSNFFDIYYSTKQTYRGIYKHFKQVNDFDFNEDGSYIVISGENILGQSDVFIYNLRNNNIKQITNDVFDDMHPMFLPQSNKSFVFNSNRPMDTLLPKQKTDYRKLKLTHDIFVYNEDSSKILAKRITNSKYNEIMPKINKAGDIYYLSDENGINSLYKKDHLTQEVLATTNYRQNFLSYDINNKQSSMAFIMLDNGKPRIFLDTLFKQKPTYNQLAKTSRQEIIDDRFEYSKDKSNNVPTITNNTPVVTRFELMNAKKQNKRIVDTTDIDIENYVFEFEKNKKKTVDFFSTNTDDNSGQISVKYSKIFDVKLKYNDIFISSPVKYKNDFGIDNVTSSFRVDPLRGVGVLGGVNMSDVMGNHRINGGIFGAFDLRTSIMWGEYEFLKYRTDFKAKVTKDVIFWNRGNAVHRYSLYKLDLTTSYPINPAMRISATPFFAQSRFTNMRVDSNNFDKITNYLGGNLEYVFDNARSIGMNANVGTRIKFGVSSYFGVGQRDKNFTKFYIDARNYTRIHRDVILASRFSAGSFVGPYQNNFILGGMDNWLFNDTQASPDSPLNTSQNQDNRGLLFADYVTNLRGFNYAAQFGNNYFLYNAELRVPIFKYLIRQQISSNFVRNFQIIGFYDFGLAWSGATPFGTDNKYNTIVVEKNPFVATVTNYRNPYIYSYGFGFRSMVLGYYTKLDFAWGVQNYVVNNVNVYLTLGYDF